MSIFRGGLYIVEDEEIREELIKQCMEAGSQAAFCRIHGLRLADFNRAIRGLAPINRKLANALGYEKIVIYRKIK